MKHRPALFSGCTLLLVAALLSSIFSAPAGAEPPGDPPHRPESTAPVRVEHEALHRKLDLARDELLLKQFAQAEDRLSTLQSEIPDTGYIAARFHLLKARVLMARGLGQAAMESISRARPEDMPAPVWGEYLKAQAAEMGGDPSRAADLFASVVRIYPDTVLGHLSRDKRAGALHAAERWDEALGAYREILKLYPEHPRRHAARFRAAQILLRQGKLEESAKEMHAVWWSYPWKEEGEKARILLQQEPLSSVPQPRKSLVQKYDRAKELRRIKHWLVAEREFLELLQEAKSQSGYSKLENEIQVQLALVRYERQDYETAIAQLEALVTQSKTRGQGSGIASDFVLELLQKSHFRSGDARKAEEILLKRVARKPSKVRFRMLSEFYWASGDYKTSWKYARRHLPRGLRRGWDYGFRMYKAENYRGALRAWERAGDKPRKQVEYWRGRAFEELGDEERALDIYASVAENYPRTYYAYQAQNRTQEILEGKEEPLLGDLPLWSEPKTLASIPAEMNSLCSSMPLNEVGGQPGPELRPARIHWLGAQEAPSPEGGVGFGTLPEEAGDPVRMFPYEDVKPLAGSAREGALKYGQLWPELHTVSFLHDLGMDAMAQEELREVSLEFRGLMMVFDKGRRPRRGKPVALSYRRWGHYIDHRKGRNRGFWGLSASSFRYPVPRLLGDKIALSERQGEIFDQRETLKEDMRDLMMEVGDFHLVRKMRLGRGAWWRHDPSESEHQAHWSEAYPRAFPHYVQYYAAKERLNPYLLWALMTVESAYNPDSVSYADARGLLQVIPKTGNKVAVDIGDNSFGEYDLLHPETSIRHGAWYFARLVKKFKGQEPLAIASYNGGPHNVQRWLKHKHEIPLDEFVEEIPFNQARRYTKKVLKFLALFMVLYEDRDGLYVGQNLSDDILVDPRY